ncbi:30619_t:CDS:2 [Racocetra persica]|uniref:30619_t:CDS:1 n=1 Tax=Racocetra persica TaxID=160502 RepID=A0ACA9KNX6_9GLOM|nr:30619_t:CDS:2 [Racocetra persica]
MAIQKIIENLGITDYLIFFFLILLIYIFNFYYKYLIRPNPLPGPLPLPFIGNLHNVAYDLRLFYDNCRSKYGDICEIMFDGRRCIVISRPEYIEKLMSQTISMRLPYLQGLDEIGLHGHGIGCNEVYKSWKYNRQFFTQALLTPKFMDTAVKSTNKLFEEMNEYWKSLGMQNSLICDNDNIAFETDFSEWFHAFSNDIVSLIVTGERTYSIASCYNKQSCVKSEQPDALVEDGDKFVKAIIKHVEGITLFMFVGPFLRHYVPIIKDMANSYLKNRDYIYDKFDYIIKKRRKAIEEMPVGAEMKTDMLTSLIIANTEKDTANVKTVNGEMFEPMVDEEIRSNLIDALLGGTDTTANVFCYITYCLCKHPNVKQRMISEIDSVFSKSPNKNYLSSDDLSKLNYCEAIIKESNRIFPIATFITRYTNEECEVAGYKWAAGTLFHLNASGVHGHPDVWPNPKVFDPDRFYNNDKVNKKSENKYSLIMFGGGPRICPGRKLGTCELLLLMALVYRYYNVELVNINEQLKVIASATNYVQNLKVRISPRI